MRCTSFPRLLSLACVLGWSTLPAEENAPTVELKMAQGTSLVFVVERESVSTVRGTERTSDSRVEYRIAAAGKNDSGDRVFTVTYLSLKSKREGGQRSFEFDSTKEDSGGERGERLRQLIGKPIKVTFGDGSVKEISGLPGQDRDEGDRPRRRRGRLFGERSLRRDLGLILAAAVQGKTLEKGKSYQAPRRETDSEGGRRRGFFTRPEVTFKYEGAKDRSAAFALSFASPEPVEEGDRPIVRKLRGEGHATISLGDGALLALKSSNESSISGSFQGREFSSETKATTHIIRRPSEAKKVSLDLPKGTTLSFVVRRAGEISWGDNSFERSSEIKYRLTSAGPKGDASAFQLAFASVKVKSGSQWNPVDFDSNDKSSVSEFGEMLRGAIAKPVTVTVAGGKIREVSGFTASGADEEDRAVRFRRFMVERIAGRRAVHRDVSLLLATAVQGQPFEKGEAYKLSPPPQDEARRRRFRFGGGSPTIVYKFDGSSGGEARFSLAAEYPPLSDEERERGIQRQGAAKGRALVSLKDGALLRLEMTAETEFSGEFQGRAFKSTAREVTSIERSESKAADL